MSLQDIHDICFRKADICFRALIAQIFHTRVVLACFRQDLKDTVNASFFVFPNFKFSVIVNLVNDNLYTFVYNYFQIQEGK